MGYLRKCLVELRNADIDTVDCLAPVELKAGDAVNGLRIGTFGTVSPLNVPKVDLPPGKDWNSVSTDDAWS